MRIFDGNIDVFNQSLKEIPVPAYMLARLSTRLSWMDEVFGSGISGAGIVPGTVILLTGDPGAGKSTLGLCVAAGLAEARYTLDKTRVDGMSDAALRAYLKQTQEEAHETFVLLNSTEEAPEQIKLRAMRLGLVDSNIALASIEDVVTLIARLDTALSELRGRGWNGVPVLVVDSIQSLSFEGKQSDNAQRMVVQLLTGWAKAHCAIVIGINQVTGSGKMAGSNKNKHAVDALLHLELVDDPDDAYDGCRWIRTRKNRFGSQGVEYCVALTSGGFKPVAVHKINHERRPAQEE